MKHPAPWLNTRRNAEPKPAITSLNSKRRPHPAAYRIRPSRSAVRITPAADANKMNLKLAPALQTERSQFLLCERHPYSLLSQNQQPFAFVHKYMYNPYMKKRDLERQLKAYGWWFLREGGRHEIWTNGDTAEPVPRHKEIAEPLAKKILKKAKLNQV